MGFAVKKSIWFDGFDIPFIWEWNLKTKHLIIKDLAHEQEIEQSQTSVNSGKKTEVILPLAPCRLSPVRREVSLRKKNKWVSDGAEHPWRCILSEFVKRQSCHHLSANASSAPRVPPSTAPRGSCPRPHSHEPVRGQHVSQPPALGSRGWPAAVCQGTRLQPSLFELLMKNDCTDPTRAKAVNKMPHINNLSEEPDSFWHHELALCSGIGGAPLGRRLSQILHRLPSLLLIRACPLPQQ